jgi:hypothetical protein
MKTKIIYILVGVVTIAIIVLASILLSKPEIAGKIDNRLIGYQKLEKLAEVGACPLPADKTDLTDFAKCLAEKKFTMYGSYWCSHCNDQKKAFGDAFKYITYVECSEKTDLCLEKDIRYSPTWTWE